MTKRRSPEPEAADDNDNVAQTVFGDLITFVMMLFILLFVLSYNEQKNADFVTQMQIKFGEKLEEKQQSMTTDALLVSKIEHYIEKEKLQDQTEVVVDEHRVKLIISPPVLFRSGRAEMRPEGYEIISAIGKVFEEVLNPLVVEGHTDDVPIHTAQYASNWELSFHRAYTVVKFLVQKFKFMPTRLSCIGYGEYRPIFPNDTLENRKKNRRIEMNVIRVSDVDSL
ncbi:MAG: hypothetical protein CL521_03805 [Actinobacteria bacterium]|nr:hypothetical protein [Actinomycetota bacterium]|tara:strand:- start:247 stop:921 length:675 start_codon:yes stop_codon:yes gene_type:complete